jgi:hypothetical protein
VAAETSVELDQQPIEAIRIGQRAWGGNPLRDQVDFSLPEPDEATWRLLRLTMTKSDGRELAIELLRPLTWIAERQATVGGTIELDLPELGAQGPAEVLAIEPSPKIQSGPGQVVTGTFRHESSRQLLNITIEGDDQPIGVTDNHPFWSEDRQQFVEACQLEVGETLSTITGTAQITSITLRGPPEPVYNLEVHGEHVCWTGGTQRLHVTNLEPWHSPRGGTKLSKCPAAVPFATRRRPRVAGGATFFLIGGASMFRGPLWRRVGDGWAA